MTTTASHPVFGKLETPEHVFVLDAAGLAALPEGTELIDADRKTFYVWTRTAQGFRYHHMVQRDHKGACWKPDELAFAAEQNGWAPFEILNPEIFGEFAPVTPAYKPRRGTHPNDGKRARLVNSWAGRVGRWNGLEVQIMQWNYGDKCAIVRPLSPRPDRWGLEEFTWNTRNIEILDGHVPTPLERFDDLPDGTVIRLRGDYWDDCPADATRVKRAGVWQCLTGVISTDSWSFEDESRSVFDADWTDSTRAVVESGVEYVIEYQVVAG